MFGEIMHMNNFLCLSLFEFDNIWCGSSNHSFKCLW